MRDFLYSLFGSLERRRAGRDAVLSTDIMNVRTVTSSTTYGKPSNLIGLLVIVRGGGGYGGGRTGSPSDSADGFAGATGIKYIESSEINIPVPITIGVGGTSDSHTGGTTSFGSFITAPGGAGTDDLYAGVPGLFSNIILARGSGGDINISTIFNNRNLAVADTYFGRNARRISFTKGANTVYTNISNKFGGGGQLTSGYANGASGVCVIYEFLS